MESFRAIREFLAACREEIRRHALVVGSLAAVAALLVLGTALPALAGVVGAGGLVALRVAAVLAVCGVASAWLVLAWLRPRRASAADDDVARWVGARVPEVASDLRSAVELERAVASADPGFSRELTEAFAGATAARLVDVRPPALVAARARRRAGQAALAATGLALLSWTVASGPLARGFARLAQGTAPSAAEAASVIRVAEPLVGDLSLTLRFPAYTGRAPVTLPASSGDVLAPRGTEVSFETRAEAPTQLAYLVLDGVPERRLPLSVEGDVIRGRFVVDKPELYRFELTPPAGRPRLEELPRRVEVEPDRAPRVDLYAPADDLEVSSRKRIELGWSVDDDYGLRELALVWKAPSGREERKKLKLAPGRTAQGKLMWDLTEVALVPGVRVAYHLEAKDNDDVGGPNIGRSRTFYLRIYSPRERHAEVIERQQQLFERMLSLLADRLEVAPGLLGPHHELHQAGQELTAELGQVAALVDKDPLASKKLRADLEAMRARWVKLLQQEGATLSDLDARAARSADGNPGKVGIAMLAEVDKKHVAELEKDVLLLDDWLQRQRLEEMLAIADEIAERRAKLEKLLEEYARTGSEKVREEIERELRALAELERELADKGARLPGELADRFINGDAMESEGAADCLEEVRALFSAGKTEAARAKLTECNEMMASAARGLEEGLSELRGEKFSPEQKALEEVMDEIADLEEEQRRLARELEELEQRYEERAAEEAKKSANPARKEAKKLVEKLKKELAAIPRDGLTPFGQEEHQALLRRVDDVERMLEEGDVAEALDMARQAKGSLETLQGDLDDDMADGEPWSDKTDEAIAHAHKAAPMIDELIEALEKATPRPEDIMSGKDKAEMQELARRQQALRERARRLGQKAAKGAQQLPQRAGEDAAKGLGEAEQKMQGAEKRMRAPDPQGARSEAEGAADALGGLRQRLRQSSRSTQLGRGDGRDDEAVHIPGAEEHKTPEEFREQILDAKRKGKAPPDYAEQIEQYYKEITQ